MNTHTKAKVYRIKCAFVIICLMCARNYDKTLTFLNDLQIKTGMQTSYEVKWRCCAKRIFPKVLYNKFLHILFPYDCSV